jgi:hypothetical protein
VGRFSLPGASTPLADAPGIGFATLLPDSEKRLRAGRRQVRHTL